MKKSTLLTLAVLIMSLSPAFAENKVNDIVIQSGGMTCEACVKTLEKSFGKEETVNDITVNLDDQTIIIDTKEDQNLTDEKIKEIIEWTGFDLILIERP